jgi:hypothetical protein
VTGGRAQVRIVAVEQVVKTSWAQPAATGTVRVVIEIDVDLVKALVAEQFPQWADLPVIPVPRQGWDNRTFRLGDELSVRLPSAAAYAAAVEKEDAVLPVLATSLPLLVPEPLAVGAPGCGYPFPWSVRRWLQGHVISRSTVIDLDAFARDLGAFLTALQGLPTGHGPVAGKHSFFRGCHPRVYSGQVDQALRLLADRVDVERCRRVWLEATATVWPIEPVWFHGDLDLGNLLVDGGVCGPSSTSAAVGSGTPLATSPWVGLSSLARPVMRSESPSTSTATPGDEHADGFSGKRWSQWPTCPVPIPMAFSNATSHKCSTRLSSEAPPAKPPGAAVDQHRTRPAAQACATLMAPRLLGVLSVQVSLGLVVVLMTRCPLDDSRPSPSK